MQGSTRTIVLVKAAGVTASATGPEIASIGQFTAARLRLSTTNNSGTTPTLDIYIQNGIRTPGASDTNGKDATGALEWNDFAHFAQATTGSGTQYMGIVGGGNFVNAAEDGALAASTIHNGPLGDRWRVKYVLGGTTPDYDFSVVAELNP